MVNCSVDDDEELARDLIRPTLAVYLGGMGSRSANYYNQLATRLGFSSTAARVRAAYLGGDIGEAIDAVDDGVIDAMAVCGPPDRVRERLAAYERAGVDTLILGLVVPTLQAKLEQLEWIAELAPNRCHQQTPGEARATTQGVTSWAGVMRSGASMIHSMPVPAVDREIVELAVDIACQAGRVAAGRFFAADFSTGLKADGSEVTDADLAVEELIRTGLQRHCAGDEVYGEEAGVTAGRSGRRWIIDPIDGTAYFAHRIPLFSTVLAYEDEYGPAASVISYPIARR